MGTRLKPTEAWWGAMNHHRVSNASREIPRAILRQDLAPLTDGLAMNLAVLFAVEWYEVLKEVVQLYEQQHDAYFNQRNVIVAERRLADAKKWDGLFFLVDEALSGAEALLPTDALKKAYRGTLGVNNGYPKYLENLTVKVRQEILRSRPRGAFKIRDR
jgi:hypothetical protein